MKAKTSRLTERFRVHLDALRTEAAKVADPIARFALVDKIDWLASSLAMGFPVLEQVEIDVLSPGDLVSLELDEERAKDEQRSWDKERLATARRERERPKGVER